MYVYAERLSHCDRSASSPPSLFLYAYIQRTPLPQTANLRRDGAAWRRSDALKQGEAQSTVPSRSTVVLRANRFNFHVHQTAFYRPSGMRA